MCILLTDHHHIAARLNSLSEDHSLHRDQRPGIATMHHWVSPTPLLCLWQTSCPYNTRGDCCADVVSPTGGSLFLCFSKTPHPNPRMLHIPHCCAWVTAVHPSLPIKTMCTDTSSLTLTPKCSQIIFNLDDSLLHLFPLYKSLLKRNLVLVSMI